jgi:hypothetical protein
MQKIEECLYIDVKGICPFKSGGRTARRETRGGVFMKKYSWILALLAALTLAFAFTACGGDDDPDDNTVQMEWKEVWEMAEDAGIQALTAGPLTFGEGVKDPQPIKPLIRAGDNDTHVTVEAVTLANGKIGLQFTTVADWGAGIDLLSKEFGFQDGDKINITGEVITIGTGGSKPQFQANGKIGGEFTLSLADGEKASTEAAGAVDWEVVLNDTAITNIKQGQGGSPTGPMPGIRLSGNGKGTVVRIDNIKIAGNRPSNLIELKAPVIAATATGVEWAEVDGAGGYKVFVEGKTDAIATLGAAATSYNLKADKALADGTYKVTAIATGETGVSKDSPASNVVDYVKDTSDVLQPGPQADGSYVLDPTSWVVWYGATVTGNAVSFTAGGASIPYPAGFDITAYKSLKADYTCKIDKVSDDADKGGVGAKITVKVLDSSKTLGQSSYYGTDVSYLGPLDVTATGGTLTLFDNSNSKWTQITGTDGDYGFAVVVNDNDTKDEFTITFESIIFYP